MSITSKSQTPLTLQASVSNAAGGTTVGSRQNISSLFNVTVSGRVTNGLTGPTVGCKLRLYIAYTVGGTGHLITESQANTGNDEITPFAADVPDAAVEVWSEFTGNTGSAVTVEAEGGGVELSTV